MFKDNILSFLGLIPQSKQCKDLKKSYLSNLVFLKCEYCKEQFHIEDIIGELNLPDLSRDIKG
jgi:hypothetical protein